MNCDNEFWLDEIVKEIRLQEKTRWKKRKKRKVNTVNQKNITNNEKKIIRSMK